MCQFVVSIMYIQYICINTVRKACLIQGVIFHHWYYLELRIYVCISSPLKSVQQVLTIFKINNLWNKFSSEDIRIPLMKISYQWYFGNLQYVHSIHTYPEGENIIALIEYITYIFVYVRMYIRTYVHMYIHTYVRTYMHCKTAKCTYVPQ